MVAGQSAQQPITGAAGHVSMETSKKAKRRAKDCVWKETPPLGTNARPAVAAADGREDAAVS